MFQTRTVVLLLLAGAAIAQTPSYTPKPYGNLQQVMRSVALPNSNVILGVQENLPKNDMDWQKVINAASRHRRAAESDYDLRPDPLQRPACARAECRFRQVGRRARARWNGLPESFAQEKQGCYQQLHRCPQPSL